MTQKVGGFCLDSAHVTSSDCTRVSYACSSIKPIKIMKKTFIALCLFFAALQLSHAQAKLPNSASTTFTKEEQEILDLSKTKWTWMADKNVESLNGLFEENCVF